MSWSGTSTCRYCWKQGHNRRTCPKVKEDAANGNPMAKYVVDRVQNQTVNKACSYCHTAGHNKKTCDKLTNDFVGAIESNKKYRADRLKTFKERGLGLGALITYKTYGDSGEQKTAIVCSIDWNNIVFKKYYYEGAVKVYDSKTMTEEELNQDMIDKITILAPAKPENVGKNIPSDWASGFSNIKAVFPDAPNYVK